MQRLLVVAVLVFASLLVEASARGGKGKKSILDYNEADVERIFQQWEVRTWHKLFSPSRKRKGGSGKRTYPRPQALPQKYGERVTCKICVLSQRVSKWL